MKTLCQTEQAHDIERVFQKLVNKRAAPFSPDGHWPQTPFSFSPFSPIRAHPFQTPSRNRLGPSVLLDDIPACTFTLLNKETSDVDYC